VSPETIELERRPFSAVSALVPQGPGCFDGDVDTRWTIGGKPNGGYLLAMVGRAVTWSGPHDHVIAASAHYVRSPEPGPVSISVEALRVGRSASQWRGRMDQDGERCVEALFTTAHIEPDTAPYWDGGAPDRGQASFEECGRIIPQLPDGVTISIMQQVEVRIDPSTAGFTSGQPSGRGELRGWLALPDDEVFSAHSLLYAVDSFPPATLDVESAGWVPTLELTAYVRALPVPGPVQILQRAGLVQARRLDESCFVWDSAGRLVAQGTQLAGIRLG